MERDLPAAKILQKNARRFIAVLRARQKCRETIDQVFDPEYNRYFYYNKNTGKR